MRVVYFLIDSSSSSNKEEINSFLSYFYSEVIEEVVHALPRGEKVKYKFCCFNERRAEMVTSISLPDDYKRIITIQCNRVGLAGASLGNAFQTVAEDFSEHENGAGVQPEIFMLVNNKTNTVAPRFEDVLKKLSDSNLSGFEKLQHASRIVICTRFQIAATLFKAKNICSLGRLEGAARDICGKTPNCSYLPYQQANQRLTRIIKFLSVPCKENTRPEYEDFIPTTQRPNPSDTNGTRGDGTKTDASPAYSEGKKETKTDGAPQNEQGGSSVTTEEQGGSSVTTQEQGGSSVTTQEQGGSSVTTREQGGSSVTTGEQGGSSVTTGEQGGSSVTTQEQGGSSVTTEEQGGSSVTTEGETSEGGGPVDEPDGDEGEIDESEILQLETEIDLAKADYEQRVALALQVCEHLRDEKDIFRRLKKRGFYRQLPFMKCFRYQDIPSHVQKSGGYLAAYLIFYIISGGKCPQDVWQDAFADYANTPMGKFEGAADEMKKTIGDFCGKRISSEFDKRFGEILVEQKRTNIQAAMGSTNGVGCAKIFELLWLIFTKKQECFNLAFLEKTLRGFHGKRFVVREEPCRETCDRTELFAVSYEGRLSKPGHVTCEDYSSVTKYDEDNWLVVVADGVGSCINSALGSKEAAQCLSNCIGGYLADRKIVGNKRFAIGNKKIPDGEYAALMHYIRFSLIKEFYKKWEEAIMSSPDYKNAKVAKMGDFATTLQFAFGCGKFIACGALGDGSFYVKKRAAAGEATSGGFIVNDGLSGVLRHEVLTVPHLKNNPNALHLAFFNYEEVSDIFISSDGVTNAVGETVNSVDPFVQSVAALPFDERCRALALLAQKCSDVNETNFGSGDDSSIAYVHINSK